MGFDITFHPISKSELKEFVFDVIENPQRAAERAAGITTHPQKQMAIRKIYGHFELWKQEWKEALAQKNTPGESFFATTFAYGAAALAGFLHPYWYARNACLSFLCERETAFAYFLESISRFSASTFPGMEDGANGRILQNYVGGGYVDLSKVRDLKGWLTEAKHKSVIAEILRDDGFQALQHVLDYALANQTGILEATDVVVPISNECVSDIDNFRADFLKTDANHQNARQRPEV